MTVHEFGKEHADAIVLFHPLGVWWDIFEYVIPILEKEYHLILPAMPGHDPDQPGSDYTRVEDIAAEMADWLTQRDLRQVRCLYGCSMGGAVVTRMLAEQKIRPACAVIDAGMTPYALPRWITFLIGVRDFLMTEMGKHMSLKAMQSVFDPSKYSPEDLQYVKKVLSSMSAKTIWRGFYSCNNYSMPSPVPLPACPVQYWYGEQEKKARKADIAYIRKVFPAAELVENPGQDHAEFFTLHPDLFCEQLSAFIAASVQDSPTPAPCDF